MNDQTVSFQCIYDILTISNADLQENAEVLAGIYNVTPEDLITELLSFRAMYGHKTFVHFSTFAKFVLLQCSETEYPLITFFTEIILILPFATADCERSFSAMNRIKSAERSRLKYILMDLMLLYDITPEEKASLDITDLARKVLNTIWKYKKKDLLSADLRKNVDENYARMFV